MCVALDWLLVCAGSTQLQDTDQLLLWRVSVIVAVYNNATHFLFWVRCSIQTQAPRSLSFLAVRRATPPPPHTKTLALSLSIVAWVVHLQAQGTCLA